MESLKEADLLRSIMLFVISCRTGAQLCEIPTHTPPKPQKYLSKMDDVTFYLCTAIIHICHM